MLDLHCSSSYVTASGIHRDNGKENENYYSILGLYRDDGKCVLLMLCLPDKSRTLWALFAHLFDEALFLEETLRQQKHTSHPDWYR